MPALHRVHYTLSRLTGLMDAAVRILRDSAADVSVAPLALIEDESACVGGPAVLFEACAALNGRSEALLRCLCVY